MMLVVLALLALICASVPAVLFCINLRAYAPPLEVNGRVLPSVSVLIPARNEAQGIEAAVCAALASRGVAIEVIVMDDGSTDGTAEIVLAMAAQEPRLRLERAPALPAGWNGKQHACWAAAHAARHPVLCFVDADVRLGPECIARMTGFLDSSRSSLVSGFPQQITVTWMEWMLLPLIHFVLLGFLPIKRMRAGTDPAFAAGCGQFLMARAGDYFACGGHSGIKLTMHDGLRLPKLFREAGIRTDLADITDLATCRMYRTAAEVWSGLAKNATEGLAAPKRIVPVTISLLLGQVLPFLALLLATMLGFFVAMILSGDLNGPSSPDSSFRFPWLPVLLLGAVLSAVTVDWTIRVLSIRRFRRIGVALSFTLSESPYCWLSSGTL